MRKLEATLLPSSFSRSFCPAAYQAFALSMFSNWRMTTRFCCWCAAQCRGVIEATCKIFGAGLFHGLHRVRYEWTFHVGVRIHRHGNFSNQISGRFRLSLQGLDNKPSAVSPSGAPSIASTSGYGSSNSMMIPAPTFSCMSEIASTKCRSRSAIASRSCERCRRMIECGRGR
jgi:hypothetical protein